MSESCPLCPQCGGKVVPGTLHTAVDPVHIESWQSIEGSLLMAYICLSCGHVELRAHNLECLARQDIVDEDLG